MIRKFIFAAAYIAINFGIYYLGLNSNITTKVFTYASIIIGLLLILLFAFCDRKNYNIIKCFIPIALLCGVLYMSVTPVFRGADEELHFYRSYEVSQGFVLSDMQNGLGGRELPSSLKEATPDDMLTFNFEKLADKISVPLNKEKTEFIPFTTASLYSPMQYLPQAVGVFIGRILNLNPAIIAYLGRFTNFIFWLLLSYLAIKNVKGMPLIFLIALLPMTLHTATTLSPDAITNSLSLLFISYIVRMAYFEKDKPITNINILLTFIMALAISLCKIVYLPLCLLFLLVPYSKFKTKKSYILLQILLVLSCVVVNLTWLSMSTKFLTEVNEGVSSLGQIKFILTNPIEYTLILFRTTAYYFNFYMHSAIGANLCLFDVPIYYWVSDLYLLLIIYLVFNYNNNIEVKKFDKYIVLIIAAALFLLINTSLYIQWTAVGRKLIDGIQGRYFLPMLPFLIFALKPKNEKNIDKYVVISAIFLTYPVIITLFLKHIQ